MLVLLLKVLRLLLKLPDTILIIQGFFNLLMKGLKFAMVDISLSPKAEYSLSYMIQMYQ